MWLPEVVRESFLEEAIFELRSQQQEKSSHASPEACVPGRGHSKQKGPEIETRLRASRDWKKKKKGQWDWSVVYNHAN